MRFLIILFLTIFLQHNLFSQDIAYITGVGSSHFEAHRMAFNAANSSGMKITQQISKKSGDGLWHVIIKVKSK